MVKTLIKLKLNQFLKNDVAIKILEDMRREIKEEEIYGDIDGSLGHTLNKFQLSRLDKRLSTTKKALTVGQHLRKLASLKGIHSFSEKKFGEAQITKTYWSRLLNDKYEIHDKDKLIRIAITLKLSLKETMSLLYKAGFTLSEENDKDKIVTFFIEEGIYNFSDIEDLLTENGLPTLFSKIRSI